MAVNLLSKYAPASSGATSSASNVNLSAKYSAPAAAPVKTDTVDLLSKYNTSAPDSSYFATTTPSGATFGPSPTLDTSGRPLLDYRKPGDTSTTTDKTRVDTTFNPMAPATIPGPQLLNTRDPSIKGNVKGSELDHSIPLELSGSNQPENLKYQSGINGGDAATSDQMENYYNDQVKQGKMSLFEAQTAIAEQKGNTTPYTDSFMDNMNASGGANLKPGANPLGIDLNSGIANTTPMLGKNINPPLPKPVVPPTPQSFANQSIGQGPKQAPLTSEELTKQISDSYNGETVKLAQENPQAVDPMVYLTKGLSFGNNLNGDPIIFNKDFPDPTTGGQKAAYAIGQIITMSIAQPVISAALSGVVSSIPALAKIATSLETIAKSGPVLQRVIPYGEAILKAGITGSIFGAITKNKQTIAQNIVQTAGMFAGFEALVYPVIAFFRPTLTSLGQLDIQNPQLKSILGDASVTEPDVSKTLWFKNPNDPNQFLKVTANGVEFTSNSNEIVEAGTKVTDVPTITNVQIEAFQKDPRLYDNLKAWIKDKTAPTQSVPFSGETPEGTVQGETTVPSTETPAETSPAPVGEDGQPINLNPAENTAPPEQPQPQTATGATTESQTQISPQGTEPSSPVSTTVNGLDLSSGKSTTEDPFVKTIRSTPESHVIALSDKPTGFDYNPQSGFISTEPLNKAVNNVTDFIKDTNRGVKAGANLDDSLYTITKEAEADRIEAIKLIKNTDITPKDAEAIYHFEEDKTLELTPTQQKIYDESIKPLADATEKIAEKLKPTIGLSESDYTPRFVAGKIGRAQAR